MTQIPPWLTRALRCPETGAPLTQDQRDGRAVLVATPASGEERVYDIDNGVPVLLPKRP